MKKLLVLIILAFIASSAFGIPQYINYSGVLKDASGTTQTGTFTMHFKIYDELTGGNCIFDSQNTSMDPNIMVSEGIYTVQLGPVTDSEFTGADRWIEISVGTETLSPRLEINSLAYAIHASSADSAATATNATNATNADKINGLHASTEATASYLFPLNSDGLFQLSKSTTGAVIKGTNSGTDIGYGVHGYTVSTNAGAAAIFAENAGNGVALKISGKIKADAASGAGGIAAPVTACVGTATITSGTLSLKVYNSYATTSSIILLTVMNNNAADMGLKISSRANGNFTVSTLTQEATTANLSFGYMIIN